MHKHSYGPMFEDHLWRHAGYEVGWTECVRRNFHGPRYWISRPDEPEKSFATAWTLQEARELIEKDIAGSRARRLRLVLTPRTDLA